MKTSPITVISLLIATLVFLPSACALTPLPAPTATAVYSQYQLAYRLVANYPDLFW